MTDKQKHIHANTKTFYVTILTTALFGYGLVLAYAWAGLPARPVIFALYTLLALLGAACSVSIARRSSTSVENRPKRKKPKQSSGSEMPCCSTTRWTACPVWSCSMGTEACVCSPPMIPTTLMSLTTS